MAKWARVDLEKDGPVIEVITYDPVGIIIEDFLPFFKPCPEEVELGYHYNPETNKFYLPETYAKHPDFATFGYIEASNLEVNEDGFIVIPDHPKTIDENTFREELTLKEKISWDNPENGTPEQISTLRTIKREFPLDLTSSTATDVFDLLVEIGFLSKQRSNEILKKLKTVFG